MLIEQIIIILVTKTRQLLSRWFPLVKQPLYLLSVALASFLACFWLFRLLSSLLISHLRASCASAVRVGV